MKKCKLYMIHFAGGDCYSFRYLSPHFSDLICVPLELPGRGRRINEPLLKDFDEAVVDIYCQIRLDLDSDRFLIYGHSMGSLIALKVAKMLEVENFNPLYVIVSGNPGPDLRCYKRQHLLAREEFKLALKELGGIPVEVFMNEDLFDFFEPILRADFEIVDVSTKSRFYPIKAPIYAIMGSEEEYCEDIENWKKYTISEVNTEILEGDHFFIYKHKRRIVEIIKSCY